METTPPMDESTGIVFAMALDGAGGGRPISHEEFSNSLPAWMHLDYSSPAVVARLKEQGVPNHVIDYLTRLETRPYTIQVDDGLVIILRGINRNAGADPEDMVSIRMWLEPDCLLSVRQRPVRAAQEVRGRLEKGIGPESVAETVIEIISVLADGIAIFVDDVEERMDSYEDRVEEKGHGEIRGEISALRRQIAAVRRYLAPQRDALESLNRLAGKYLDSEQLFSLREQSDRVTRYVEDLDLVRERALVVQEEIMNRVAQEQNARTYLFSVVATIFLPITFVTGMFGMNTAGLPGLENDRAFWLVVIGMVVIAIGLTIWLRLKKWF
jgi:zinc transporter